MTSKALAVAAFVVSAAFHAAMSLCVKLVGAQLMSRKNPGKKIHPQKTINGLSSVNLNYFHGVFWGAEGGGSDSGRWGNKKSLPAQAMTYTVLKFSCNGNGLHFCNNFS